MTLSSRIEAASADQQRELLEEAFCVSRGVDLCGVKNGATDIAHVYPDWFRFTAKLDAEAFIDAALTLVPEGMRDEIEITTLYQVARVGINLNHGPDDGPYYGENACNSIALALAAAATKIKESERAENG